MKRIKVTLALLFISLYLFSQDRTMVKYFRDSELTKETAEPKARYKVILTWQSNNLTQELFEISTNRLIWHKSFRNHKPFGEWYLFDENNSKKVLVVYGTYKPQNYFSYDVKDQKLTDSIGGEFTRPKFIIEDKTISSYIKRQNAPEIPVWVASNVRYPVEAQMNKIQGKVKAQFTIDENGEINHIMIIEGVDEALDFEAYRVLKSMPKMQPARLNGKAINLYVEVPINFVVR